MAEAVPLVAKDPTDVGVVRRVMRSSWGNYALRRLGGLVLSLAVLVVLTFAIVPLIPGDPALAILGTHATPESVQIMHHKLHLDLPTWQQFALYLQGVATLDLGNSFHYGTPVTTAIATKLPYTATVAFSSIILVLLIAVPVGMAVGVLTRGGRRPWLATGFGLVAGFFASFPSYVAGALLIVVFAIWWKILPAGGAGSPAAFVLPVLALALGPTFAVARVVRQETFEVLQQDFMRTARGHRITATRLYLRHALPNLMTATLTLTGLILAGMLGGAIIIESVFNLPGLGMEIVQAIIYRDYPMVQGIVLTVGGIAIAINLLIDVILGLIDPRTLGGAHHG